MRKLLTVLAGATLVIGLSGPAVSASSAEGQSSDQIEAMGKRDRGRHGDRHGRRYDRGGHRHHRDRGYHRGHGGHRRHHGHHGYRHHRHHRSHYGYYGHPYYYDRGYYGGGGYYGDPYYYDRHYYDRGGYCSYRGPRYDSRCDCYHRDTRCDRYNGHYRAHSVTDAPDTTPVAEDPVAESPSPQSQLTPVVEPQDHEP